MSPPGPGEKDGGPMSISPERGSWRVRIPVWLGLGMSRADACVMLRLALMVECIQERSTIKLVLQERLFHHTSTRKLL